MNRRKVIRHEDMIFSPKKKWHEDADFMVGVYCTAYSVAALIATLLAKAIGIL